ncbi:MAG TPA: Ig-like domain-containing protein, partial [Candidatus Thermoplasmatota archaeon]
MRAERLAAAAFLLSAALVGPTPSQAAPEGDILERPLFVVIDAPQDGSAQPTAGLQAVIRAGGSSLTFAQDDFADGLLVNASRDATGVFPNATAPGDESLYESRVFEHPDNGSYLWTPPLDVVMSGGSGDVLPLVGVEVRFGDRTPARNWSAWVDIGLGGDFRPPPGETNYSLASPAAQYRVLFLDPTNASTPRVTFVGFWYHAPLGAVYARLGASSAWELIGNASGQFRYNATLAAGANLLQARAVDTAGHELIATAAVTFDREAPRVASAPADGAVIRVDQAAEIAFSEPVDAASAAAAIVVDSSFAVDRVWTADGTRLLLSAAAAPSQGEVTVTVGPGLTDRAGNRFNDTQTWTYTMGPATAAPATPVLLVALLVAGAVAAAVAVWHSGRLREQRRQ